MYPIEFDNYIKIVKGCKYYGRYTDDSYIIHESKEFLNEILKELINISNKLGLTLNENKTHIVKISQNFKVLQIKYFLTDTGKIVKRTNNKTITRERRKLKAYKRLLDNNRITLDEIENIFKGWISNNYKNMSKAQIKNLYNLYLELFGRRIKWKKHGKLRYLMEQNLQT